MGVHFENFKDFNIDVLNFFYIIGSTDTILQHLDLLGIYHELQDANVGLGDLFATPSEPMSLCGLALLVYGIKSLLSAFASEGLKLSLCFAILKATVALFCLRLNAV